MVDGANPADIGFEAPDELDQLRVEFFNEICYGAPTRNLQHTIYTLFDLRFLAKLGIGVAYSLFGKKALQTAYAEELYKALQYRNGDTQPQINATSLLADKNDPHFSKLIGEENAVTITILPSAEGIVVNLNLGASLNWTVMCANYEGLTDEDIRPFQEGVVILLYRQLQRGVTIALPEYMAHKCGNYQHPELTEISTRCYQYRDYFKNL